MPLASLISAGASVFNSIFGSSSAKRQQQREMNFNSGQAQLNRDFQREERLAVQDYNVDMWNMANEYNSPANQLKRAQEAGINPNAIIGGIDNSSSGVVSSSPMSGSQASYSSSIADSLLTLNPELAQMAANTLKTLSEKESIDIANDFAPKFNDASLKKCYAEVDRIGKEAGFTEEQTKQMKELFPLMKGKNDAEIKKMQEEINNLFEQRKQIIAQINNIDASTNNINASTNNINANTANVAQDTKLKQWENNFISRFNVSPNAGVVQSILQLLGSGEKGSEVARSMINTMFDIAASASSAIADNVKNEFIQVGDSLLNSGSKALSFSSRHLPYPYNVISSLWRIHLPNKSK